MTLLTFSLLMFHCNQKAIVRKMTLSMPILLPCRAEQVSVIWLSWTVIHSNKCKSPFCVVGPVLTASSADNAGGWHWADERAPWQYEQAALGLVEPCCHLERRHCRFQSHKSAASSVEHRFSIFMFYSPVCFTLHFSLLFCFYGLLIENQPGTAPRPRGSCCWSCWAAGCSPQRGVETRLPAAPWAPAFVPWRF